VDVSLNNLSKYLKVYKKEYIGNIFYSYFHSANFKVVDVEIDRICAESYVDLKNSNLDLK